MPCALLASIIVYSIEFDSTFHFGCLISLVYEFKTQLRMLDVKDEKTSPYPFLIMTSCGSYSFGITVRAVASTSFTYH